MKQHLALFSTVIQQGRAYIRGAYNRMYFFCFFQVDGAYNRKGGGGGGV